VISGPMISVLSRSFLPSGPSKIGLSSEAGRLQRHPDYKAATDADGHYSALVNDGWTGTIETADPANCIFTPEKTQSARR